MMHFISLVYSENLYNFSWTLSNSRRRTRCLIRNARDKIFLKVAPVMFMDLELFFLALWAVKDYNATSPNGGWQKAKKRERVADVMARDGGSREQQVVDAKERSTDVKSWGNKKVALILAGRANKGPWQQATRGLARNSGGKNGRKQNERLKIPSSRYNGILPRHLRPFYSLPSLSLSFSFASRFAVIRPIARVSR